MHVPKRLRGNRKVNFEQIDFLSEEDAEFCYNEEDKLYYSEVGEDSTSILYSANGYRYLKQENTTYPEFYVYDSNGRLNAIARPVNLVAEDNSIVTVMYPIIQYIWGADRVLAQIDVLADETYYYLYNGHGDVVQIVDTSGTIKNTYDYDVWGNFITKQEIIDNHFTYFGQTYDETTGLYYLRARYYDPTTGRFTQQDPAEDGYNWYIYGNQNPVIHIDPMGESATATATVVITAPEWVPWVLAGVSAAVTAMVGYFAHNNQKGLEKGMSSNQKEMFQREIEDYKRGMGKGPGDHLPWEILVEIAEEIRKNYK